MAYVRKYDIQGFLDAHIDAVGYERAHPDLATHYSERYAALCRAFGFDLRQLDDSLDVLFKSAVRSVLSTHGAFSGFLEAPPIVGELAARHASKIREAVVALRQAHVELMLDILERAHGRCEKVVDSTDLLQLGFDDSAGPDPDNYW